MLARLSGRCVSSLSSLSCRTVRFSFASSLLRLPLLTTPSRTTMSFERYRPIYTRAGDGGKSSLLDGDIRPKTSSVFHVMGGLDELSCQLAVCCEYLPNVATEVHLSCIPSIADGANSGNLMIVADRLRDIQRKLFVLNAHVANRLSPLPGIEVRIMITLKYVEFLRANHISSRTRNGLMN